jgi:hypothetical protein
MLNLRIRGPLIAVSAFPRVTAHIQAEPPAINPLPEKADQRPFLWWARDQALKYYAQRTLVFAKRG